MIRNPIVVPKAVTAICFGSEPLSFLSDNLSFNLEIDKQVNLDGQDILVTSSLDSMLESVEAKKSFWKVLQQYV